MGTPVNGLYGALESGPGGGMGVWRIPSVRFGAYGVPMVCPWCAGGNAEEAEGGCGKAAPGSGGSAGDRHWRL